MLDNIYSHHKGTINPCS